MKIIRTANYDDLMNQRLYERVVFMQGDDAQEALNILDQQGEDAAIAHLAQWHNPGEHETSRELGAGTSDRTYEKDGYILSYNLGLGYIGLDYDSTDDGPQDDRHLEVTPPYDATQDPEVLKLKGM